jgi:hypothetical protein
MICVLHAYFQASILLTLLHHCEASGDTHSLAAVLDLVVAWQHHSVPQVCQLKRFCESFYRASTPQHLAVGWLRQMVDRCLHGSTKDHPRYAIIPNGQDNRSIISCGSAQCLD